MPYLQLPDAQLYYTDQGDGPALVMVHGYTCDSVDWTWSLPDLLKNFRVICYDRRGEGRSTRPGGRSIRDEVDDLIALSRHLELDQPVMVGHSLGGAIVSGLAVEHPGFARALVVIDPPYAAAPEVAALAGSLLPVLRTDAAHAAIKDLWRARCYTAETPDWTRLFIERRIDALPKESLHDGLLTLFGGEEISTRPAAERYLARRELPVLAFHSTSGLAEIERATMQHPRSEVLDWAGAGHWLQVERPGEFAQKLTRWVLDLLDDHEAVATSTN